MPSDLQITNIKDQANANSAITIASDGQITVNQNNPTVTLGSNATFPAGHVLQVVSNSSTNNITSASTSYVEGLNISITPISTSNKILIMCNTGSMDYTGTVSAIYLALFKGGSQLKEFSAVSFGGGEVGSRSFVYLDSPSTTSSTTYAIYFKSGHASQTAYLNEGSTGTVSIVAMEIQG